MSKEKLILSFIAILVGLLFAALGFYFYQGARFNPNKQEGITIKAPTPIPKPNVILNIDEPKDEKVYDKKIIEVRGKTTNDSLIVILTENDEQVLSPTELGDFSTTITLQNGENFIQITAIAENGESLTVDRTVTYSTESF